MSSLANLHLQSNTKIKINFNGGNLSSDAGLLLLHEFVEKLGLQQLFKSSFKTTDKKAYYSMSGIAGSYSNSGSMTFNNIKSF